MAQYLLDTKILSEASSLNGNAQVIAKLNENAQLAATVAVVMHELLYGCYRLPVSRRRTALERYLTGLLSSSMPVLAYTIEAADWHAHERARLSQVGRTSPYVDGQIAAIAAINQLVLVTRNVADFAAFQNLPLENWFA
ncbi:type II toxin-antitoxin system VapC family toxin [Halomicronema sp. CCY15110]|uniref:type II toxin-antitoxin system VapC family toxin n=1 Tax=Halomicronema sp. CCY15110 TaxID=2767773 RepID=UPI001EF20797|nr:type II toxin-antitoxin system VapC family toxin [Halomicronema sp. CCY15110]